MSYGETSIYSLSINKTGSIVQEVGIRLPEVRGHIISIAKAPNGEIYIGGEKIYKLASLDNNRIRPLTYFIEAVSKNFQVNYLSVNLTNKVIAIDIARKNNTNENIENASVSSLQVMIPKALIGGISQVTSEKYNETSASDKQAVQNFKTKETLKVSNVGDTIIDIELKNNVGNEQDPNKRPDVNFSSGS